MHSLLPPKALPTAGDEGNLPLDGNVPFDCYDSENEEEDALLSVTDGREYAPRVMLAGLTATASLGMFQFGYNSGIIAVRTPACCLYLYNQAGYINI
jgi:hypothetical protein